MRYITGYEKISYVGHSQGTTQMFSALAEGHGNLSSKLSLFVAICPVTNLNHASNAIGQLTETMLYFLAGTLSNFKIYEILGPSWIYYQNMICRAFPCEIFSMFYIMADNEYNDSERAQIANFRAISHASSKQLVHFAQSSVRNDFS